MSQFAEKTQKQFSELEASHDRMKTLTASMDKIVKTLQEGHAQLSKASEETNKRLNGGVQRQPQERGAEVTKKKNSCHNCGSTDHYANNCPKTKKKVYSIKKVPEEESPTEDSESDSMGDAIREQTDEEQDPREEFLAEYQEETSLEIQDIHLEVGVTGALRSEEGLALSKLGLTYGGLKDMVRRNTLKSVKDELLKE
ncbi:hypothetical protein O181_126176 [Austropuccinia psidii MF-1]|uniref:CCHC-type domain-containing protein n=1 Tax=Austropuccinia psidii MF-1 TaxID=1389203 RepID=A0A9Q3Q5P4_9BASI|nr:hypothetical protein [Austropuccinia psidii MF-1]